MATFNYRTLANSVTGPVTTLNFNAVPRRWRRWWRDSPRSATATALEDTLLLAFDRDRLRSLAHQKPEVAWAFCKELGMRLREANERLRSLSVQLKATA